MLPAQFIRPDYESACFYNIPHTIRSLLTGRGSSPLRSTVLSELPQQYDQVVLIFIDAFGWRFFEKACDRHPFLRHIVKEGMVAKLTSQFPSTTANHITSIHTGLSARQHGIFEWRFYEPQLDTMITPLLFSFSGSGQRETLKTVVRDPQALFPKRTFYQELAQLGITSYALQPREYTPSTYADIMLQGANVYPYKTLPEAFVNLSHLLIQQRSPAYFFLYIDSLDSICHRYGPNAPQVDAEINVLLTIIERLLFYRLRGQLKKTLLMITADHGHVEVDPATTTYLNLHPECAGIESYLKTNRDGQLLVPGGSCRDMFLYIQDHWLDEAHTWLSECLAGKAVVYKVQDLLNHGLFGPLPNSDAFLGRVGNLVILPYRHQSVWWYEAGRYEQRHYGAHGGLTPQEMEIPLLLLDFSM
ncbi:MAG: alkaline phosphatase family protein [Ardenticatenaceae bacterium]